LPFHSAGRVQAFAAQGGGARGLIEGCRDRQRIDLRIDSLNIFEPDISELDIFELALPSQPGTPRPSLKAGDGQ
jgi:hypothetical protein